MPEMTINDTLCSLTELTKPYLSLLIPIYNRPGIESALIFLNRVKTLEAHLMAERTRLEKLWVESRKDPHYGDQLKIIEEIQKLVFCGKFDIPGLEYHRWRWAWKQLMDKKSVTWKNWNPASFLVLKTGFIHRYSIIRGEKVDMGLYGICDQDKLSEAGWTLYEVEK